MPNVPVQHPQLGDGPPSTRVDEYPLLTLPEQRRSRQSPAPSSLVVERSTGDDSHRTSIALPRDRRSLAIDSQPATPRLKMPVEEPESAQPADGAADGSRDRDPAAVAIPHTRADDLEGGMLKDIKPSSGRASLPSRPSHSIKE